MRSSRICLALLAGLALQVPLTNVHEATVAAAEPAPKKFTKLIAGNPRSLVSGSYLLFLNPKKIGGKMVITRRPGILPVSIKTDGKVIVLGGRFAPQMTGTIVEGKLALTHIPGTSLTLNGATFNGYAASGTFSGGGEGNFEGTFGLVTASRGGRDFMNNFTGAGVTWERGPTLEGALKGSLPNGVNGHWGYDGPGLNMNGMGGGSQSAFQLPGSLNGNNANGDDWSWSSAKGDLDLTKGGSKGGTEGGHSQREAKARFDNSCPPKDPDNDPLPVNTGSAGDEVYCFFVACAPAPAGGGDIDGGGTDGGKFTAGDWEPAGGGGDTSPGQTPNTGNGQEQGSASANGGNALRMPSHGGDPGDLFKPGPGDILNANKLFNGSADPVRGVNFGR